MWRDRERQLARPALAPQRDADEAAIGRLLGYLQRLTTMDKLVGLYFSDGYKVPSGAGRASSSPICRRGQRTN